MRTQPKKNITKITKATSVTGKAVRKSYQRRILDKSAVFPKPLEYDDIDKAMFEFVDKTLDLAVDGKKVPTYTLYSNQRFSEYTQMWEHSDENGNLYLNFKTINRDKNPSFGSQQGELWNIPGRRKYMVYQRDVLEDNGLESTEVYSMTQPYAVDLSYTINFITVTLENLNKFNQKLNKIFASRQHYIRPNGHYLPLVIDEISDETSYSISDRKFYVQSVSIKLMAYIIESEDFEVTKYPKRIQVAADKGLYKTRTSCVEIEEIENPLKNMTLNVNMTIEPYKSKIEFEMDGEMVVESVNSNNSRHIRVMVNDDLAYIQKPFKIHEGDNIRVQVKALNPENETKIVFSGYDPTQTYDPNEVPEKVYDEKPTHEEIVVE